MAGCNRKVSIADKFQCRQLVVVSSSGWDATRGILRAFALRGDKWVAALPPIPITLGRNGMAWGAGLHEAKFNTTPLTREGAGKSPAGIFPLESLYGYEDFTAKMDYLKVDENTFCVDDPKSVHYNKIVRGDQVEKDWKSAETMRLKSDAYKFGIVVGYNTNPPVPGKGSCIFIHLGEPDGTTAGCTAMSEADILSLINFLDKSQNPLLVQAPYAAYRELSETYNLPEVPAAP